MAVGTVDWRWEASYSVSFPFLYLASTALRYSISWRCAFFVIFFVSFLLGGISLAIGIRQASGSEQASGLLTRSQRAFVDASGMDSHGCGIVVRTLNCGSGSTCGFDLGWDFEPSMEANGWRHSRRG